MKNKSFMLVTLGCFRNEVESDLLRGALVSLGIEETGSLESADIVLVNTCGFIAEACDEGIDTILELHELCSELPGQRPLLAVGCMVQRYGAALAREMPELSGVIGTSWQAELEVAVKQLLEGKRYDGTPGPPGMPCLTRTVDSSENATLLVRVADGCDRSCLFCSIPSIRGTFVSRPPGTICDEIQRLASGRQREVILLAQDLTSYGSDLRDGSDLPGLLRLVTEIPQVRWLRMLYLQPEGVTPELIGEVAANPKVCDYFDIPFQHASGSVLRRMGRPGSSAEYLRLLESIRHELPEASIRSTVMVGYPGETEDDFEVLKSFIEEARLDWLGAFIYSAEEGTSAASLDEQVPSEVAVSRYNMVVDLQDRIEESAISRFEGRKLEVVLDGLSEIDDFDLVGRSYREAPVVDGVIYLKKRSVEAERAAPGGFARALITGREGLDLAGEI